MKKSSNKNDSSNLSSGDTSASREFKQSSYIPAKRTFKRRVRSFYKHNKVVFYALVGLILVLLFTIVLGIFSLFSKTDAELSENKYWLSEPINSNRLFATFIEKSFGGQGHEFLQSVQFSGKLVKEEVSQAFFFLKKRPRYAIFRTDLRPGFELTYGVNLDQVWGRLRIRDKDDKVYSVTGEEAEQIGSLAAFMSPFVELAISESPEVISVNLSEDLGMSTVRVEFISSPDGTRSVSHLNVDNLQLIQRVDFLPDGSTAQVDYSDYRAIEEIWFPFESLHYAEGVLTQKIVIEEIKVNPGIVTSLFEPPAGLDSPSGSNF